MTSNANITGAFQPLVCQVLEDISVTPIGETGSDNTLTVKSVSIANPTGSPVASSVFWSYGGTDNLIWAGSVAAGETETMTEPSFPLREGGQIKAKGADGVCVSVSFIMNVSAR